MYTVRRFAPSLGPATVVGVAGRVKQYSLDEDSRIAMYFPQTQVPIRAMNVVLRSAADPAALAASVKGTLAAIDPDLPMYRVRTMAERLDESVARRRFAMLRLSLFAALALGLAAVGVYGVLAYLVSQGTRDFGIRLALGATPGEIGRLIVRSGMAVTAAGALIGVAGAFLLARFIEALLFGVAPADPVTFVAIPVILMLVALAASVLPAWRAARIDPVVCLRGD